VTNNSLIFGQTIFGWKFIQWVIGRLNFWRLTKKQAAKLMLILLLWRRIA